MWGLVLFAIASFVGGFAQSETTLIAARAVQGLGAALLSPAALSILTSTFREGAERNRALGVWGGVAGAGGAAGVLLGGILPSTSAGAGSSSSTSRSPRAPSCWRRVWCRRAATSASAAGSTSRAPSRSPPGLAVLIYALVDANDAGWGSTQTVVC